MKLTNVQVTRIVEALHLAGVHYQDADNNVVLESIDDTSEPWRGRLEQLADDIITIVGRERVVELDTAIEFSQHKSRKE